MLLVTTGSANVAAPVEHPAAITVATVAPHPAVAVHRVYHRVAVRRKPVRAKKILTIHHVSLTVPDPPYKRKPVRHAVSVKHVTPKPTNVVGVVGTESVYTFVDSLPQPWPRIVRCESLRDNSWHTYSRSMARGLFQFLRSTWRRMGGTGDPAAASWVEQYVMALKLERTEGLRSWDCARMLGLA